MKLAAILCVTVLFVATPGGAKSPEIIHGRAASFDDGTLSIAGRRVQLFGVTEPEMDDWTYGVWARAGLDGLLRELGPLRCEIYGRSARGHAIAVCRGNHPDGSTRDLGEWMIRAGYAVAAGEAPDDPSAPDWLSARYQAAEAAARLARRGFWRGRAGY